MAICFDQISARLSEDHSIDFLDDPPRWDFVMADTSAWIVEIFIEEIGRDMAMALLLFKHQGLMDQFTQKARDRLRASINRHYRRRHVLKQALLLLDQADARARNNK
jgi:hypothetical protein